MGEELGSLGSLSSGLTIGLLVSAPASLLIGRLVDQGHARVVMTTGSALAAILLVAWSMVTSIQVFWCVWAGLGLVMAAVLYEPAFAVLVYHYRERHRQAITRMTIVGGLASTIFIPVTYWLNERLGWRGTLQSLGLAHLLVCLPIHLSKAGNGSLTGIAEIPAYTLAGSTRILRSAVLWLVAGGLSAAAFVFSGVSAHLLPIMRHTGLTGSVLLVAAAVIGVAQVASRALILLDPRLAEPRRLALVVGSATAVALSLLSYRDAAAVVLVVFAVLFGAANGLATVLRATSASYYLPGSSYGAATALLLVPSILARAAAPAAVAVLWDVTGGYQAAVAAMTATALAGALMFLVASRTLASNRHVENSTHEQPKADGHRLVDLSGGVDAFRRGADRQR